MSVAEGRGDLLPEDIESLVEAVSNAYASALVVGIIAGGSMYEEQCSKLVDILKLAEEAVQALQSRLIQEYKLID